ncbi:MAG TPA: hypothetical protein VIT42_01220 [Microlunatus sp.]
MVATTSEPELVQLEQHVPFTMVENSIIQKLGDYVALGLYLDMRSKPPGWRINLANLAKTKKQGRESLTAAMNMLIELGLVFRVKYQRPTGQWATRIYITQRPVTLAELSAVRDSYSGKCTIITTAELSEHANNRHVEPGLNNGHRHTEAAGNPTHSPTDGKPTVGEPTIGLPAVGQPDVAGPTVGNPAAKEQEFRSNNPPPTPSDQPSGSVEPGEGEEEYRSEKGTLGLGQTTQDSEVDSVTELVAAAWPHLGGKDLGRLRVPIAEGLASGLSGEELSEHLTRNTGGVRHPLAVLLGRCDNLPRPRTRPRPMPEWCGSCEAVNHRWIEVGPNREPMRCPTCNPRAHPSTNDPTEEPTGAAHGTL